MGCTVRERGPRSTEIHTSSDSKYELVPIRRSELSQQITFKNSEMLYISILDIGFRY